MSYLIDSVYMYYFLFITLIWWLKQRGWSIWLIILSFYCWNMLFIVLWLETFCLHLCWVFLNLCVDVICLQCLQIRIPAAQCSHWSICPHSGWYACLTDAYPMAAMAIMIQTMEIKHCALLETTLDAVWLDLYIHSLIWCRWKQAQNTEQLLCCGLRKRHYNGL